MTAPMTPHNPEDPSEAIVAIERYGVGARAAHAAFALAEGLIAYDLATTVPRVLNRMVTTDTKSVLVDTTLLCIDGFFAFRFAQDTSRRSMLAIRGYTVAPLQDQQD